MENKTNNICDEILELQSTSLHHKYVYSTSRNLINKIIIDVGTSKEKLTMLLKFFLYSYIECIKSQTKLEIFYNCVAEHILKSKTIYDIKSDWEDIFNKKNLDKNKLTLIKELNIKNNTMFIGLLEKDAKKFSSEQIHCLAGNIYKKYLMTSNIKSLVNIKVGKNENPILLLDDFEKNCGIDYQKDIINIIHDLFLGFNKNDIIKTTYLFIYNVSKNTTYFTNFDNNLLNYYKEKLLYGTHKPKISNNKISNLTINLVCESFENEKGESINQIIRIIIKHRLNLLDRESQIRFMICSINSFILETSTLYTIPHDIVVQLYIVLFNMDVETIKFFIKKYFNELKHEESHMGYAHQFINKHVENYQKLRIVDLLCDELQETRFSSTKDVEIVEKIIKYFDYSIMQNDDIRCNSFAIKLFKICGEIFDDIDIYKLLMDIRKCSKISINLSNLIDSIKYKKKK